MLTLPFPGQAGLVRSRGHDREVARTGLAGSGGTQTQGWGHPGHTERHTSTEDSETDVGDTFLVFQRPLNALHKHSVTGTAP